MDFESFKRKSNYFAGKDIYFPLHQLDSFVSPIFNDNRMKFKLQTQQSHQSPKSTTQNTSDKQVFPEKKKSLLLLCPRISVEVLVVMQNLLIEF